MHYYITHYIENGTHWAESWFQINAFGKCFCFLKKRIMIGFEF